MRSHIKKIYSDYSFALRVQKYNLAIINHGFDALKIINQLLHLHNINYWLYAGTLLGIIRDNDFIIGDTDVDIGVWSTPGVQEKLELILTENGFIKIWKYSCEGKIREQRFEYNGVGIDFYYFLKTQKYSYASAFQDDDKGYYLIEEIYDIDTFNNLTTVKINGIDLCIPVNYEHVFESLYGDWKTPISKRDGFVMFAGPNQIHRKNIRAEFTSYRATTHKNSILEVLLYFIYRRIVKFRRQVYSFFN